MTESSERPQPPVVSDSVEITKSRNRLLVMACLAAKKKAAGLLPAIVRYDGPAFHVLRKYLAHATDAPTVLILSAKYGMLGADHPIPDYDCRITAEAAEAIRPDVMRGFGEQLRHQRY